MRGRYPGKDSADQNKAPGGEPLTGERRPKTIWTSPLSRSVAEDSSEQQGEGRRA